MTNEVIELLEKYCDGKENIDKVEISVLQLHRIIKALEQQTCTREDFIQYAKEHYGIDIEFKDSDKPDTFNGLFGVEVYEDAVSRNLIIQTLNKMDRYVADELMLCDTDKKFPKNEVFIVDDVYEQIVEQLPSVQPKQEPCEDAVSRSEAIKALKDVTNLNGEPLFESLGLYPWNLLNDLPSVNPQPICEEREKGECPYYAR